VIAAAAAALVFATAASADSLTWNEDGAMFTGFGANQQVTIYMGTISFLRIGNASCIPDFVTAFTDAYVVPHGTVTLGTKLPTVAVGGEAHVIASTVSGGLFIDESLGFTKPGGKIGKGLYDVVYDNCQDGVFDATDTLFSPAFSVDYGVDIPEEPPEYIASAKERAKERLEHYEDLHKSAERMFLAFKAMELMLALANEHTAEHFPVPRPDPGDAFFFFMNLAGPLQLFEHMAVNEIVQTVRHYQALVDDPPDPDYRHLDALGSRPQIALQAGHPVDVAIANVGTQLGAEAALVHALRVALERYNGAREADDPTWALAHARAIRSLADETARQLDRTAGALGGLSSALAADGAPLDEAAAELETIRQRWVTAGLTSDDRRDLRNLGYGDAEIDALVAKLTAQPLLFTKAGFQSTLATLQSTVSGLQSSLTALATAMGPIVTKLAADPLVTDSFPTADVGGPYSGTEGTSIAFDGTASTSPSAIASYSWDLDGDGVFGDATGPTPSYRYSTLFDGLVGLQVTNADGMSSVAYARIHVVNVNSPPRIDSVSPDPRRASVLVGGSRRFSVATTDPDGDPVTVKWTVDGTDAGTGSAFTYTPTASAIGLRTIGATASDGNSLGGSATTMWAVLVVAADGDDDHWDANVDCDDADASVNPGHIEVVGNGKNDDCDDASPDSGSPPVAAFSHGAAVAGTPISFTDGSTDPNGDIASWSWDFGDLSGTDTHRNPTHTYTAPGTYTVSLTVTDATGKSDAKTAQLTVTRAPTATFTYLPPAPTPATAVQFTDTSTEPGGSIVGWSWTFGGGSMSGERNPIHSYALPGAYAVTLVVTDASGVVASVTQTITVLPPRNRPPVALFDPQGAGGNLALAERGASILSSSSQYSTGYPVATLIDRNTTNSYWATAAGETSGSAVVALGGDGGPYIVDRVGIMPATSAGERVRDFAIDLSTTGAADADFTQALAATAADNTSLQTFQLPRPVVGVRYVRYRPLNNRGSACCVGTQQLTVLTGQEGGATVHFADLATDPDGDTLSYSWTFGDGSAGSTQQNADHTFPGPGTYTVTETVSDGVHSSSFSLQQKVFALPAAAFTTTVGSVGRALSFTDASTSRDSVVVAWSWDFGDGGTSTAQNPTHIYSAAGTYTVRLTVTDAVGETDSTMRPVPVRAGYVTLTTGPGDGGLTIDVGGYGDFGYQLLPESVTPPGRGDALYDPVGPARPGSTSWESALQLRRPGQATTYVSSGLVGAQVPQGGLDNPGIEQTSPTRAVSSFDVGGLHFELEQTVESIFRNGTRTGSVLTQTYRLTNTLPAVNDFDLIRYYEGDLTFGFGAAVPDGGGHLVSGGQEFVFETDKAGTPATGTDFVGVTAEGGLVPRVGRYEVGQWTPFPERIRQGLPLCDCVFNDLDGDSFVDAGRDYDVGIALSNRFVALGPGATATYVTKTYFGSGPPTAIVNRPPVAQDVAASTHTGTPTQVTLAATDPDGDPLTYSAVSQPLHGTVSLTAVVATYTPNPRFAGADSFTYRANDGKIDSNLATVTIHVTDGSPVAADDHFTTVQGQSLQIADPGVLENDSDPDGDRLVAVATTPPAHGTLALAPGGGFDYEPDTGFHGTDSFAYGASDGGLDSVPATVRITVDGPPHTVDDTVSTRPNVPVPIDPTANDTDSEGDPLALVTASLSSPAHGTLEVDGATVTYTPDHDYVGDDSFTYRTTDGLALSDPATVTIHVVDRAPTVTVTTPAAVDESSSVMLAATAADADGDALTYSWSTDLGTVISLGDGSRAEFSADDGPATAHVTVTVSDGQLDGQTTESVEVRNVAPSVTAASEPTTQFWGLPVHFAGSANDPSQADTAHGFSSIWSFGDLVLSPHPDVTHVYDRPGTYRPSFAAVDKDGGSGEAAAPAVTVQKRRTSIAFSAPTTQPFGPTQLAARLTDVVDTATERLANHTLTFTLNGRSLTATTNAAGVATVVPAPFVLSGTVHVSFAGDELYTASTTDAQLTITDAFGASPGFFTLGDRTAVLNANVSWWTPQWWRLNVLSGGAAPSAFKGFVNSVTIPGCGDTWQTDPGNSSDPPDSVGAYLAIVVPSRLTRLGATISGNTAHIVAVKTTPGYGPAPGHDGTGQIVGTVC
jgi:PKD repeat protein